MGFNMQKLMKQAQKMQDDMAKLQEELGEMMVEGVAGGGMVKAVVNGQQELLSLSIAAEVIDPEEKEMLEDLVTAAIKEALRLSKELQTEEMQKITGGMGLPGMPGGLF